MANNSTFILKKVKSYSKDETLNKKEIYELLTDAFKYKGEVADENALNNISSPDMGDTYKVASLNQSKYWDGNSWENFTPEVDLTDYYTKTEIDPKIPKIIEISTQEQGLQLSAENPNNIYWIAK